MQFIFRINHTVILEDPFDDPPDLPVPDRSPEPTKEQLDVSPLIFSIFQYCECRWLINDNKSYIDKDLTVIFYFQNFSLLFSQCPISFECFAGIKHF